MKKFISFALFAILVFALSVTAFAAETVASGYCGGEGDGTNLEWVLTEDGTLTISGEGAMADYMAYGSENRPPWINFTINSLVLENGITTIGDCAFYNGIIKGNLDLPDSLINIGMLAFRDCSGLTGKLVIPNSVTSIGEGAFDNCSGFDRYLVISENITTIESNVFSGCSGFTGKLIIPENVTTIDSSAFRNCSGFTGNLIIPENVTTIGSSAFNNCSGFTGDIIIPEKIRVIESSAFSFCSGFNGSLILNEMVEEIREAAFHGCTKLNSTVILPESVDLICLEAFTSCGIENFYFEGNAPLLQYIDDSVGVTWFPYFDVSDTIYHAFVDHTWIIENGKWNGHTAVGIIASGYCGGEGDGTNLKWALTEDGTLTIFGKGEMADYEVDWNTNSPMSNAPWAGYANQINKLVFEEGIEYIGSNGFFRMRNIRQELIIPSSVKVIGREAFAQTSFLGNLVIPEGVEKIEYEAFSYSYIDTAEISSTVTEIDTRAFYYCYNLESINVSENNEVYSDIDGVLCSKDKKKLVIFPKGRGEKYRIPDGITVIGEECFAAVEGGVVIGKDVETIAYNAFVLFEGKILLEHQVEYIDSKAFSRWGGNYNKIDIYFINGAPIEVAENAFLMDEFCTINLYYLSGTENLWKFDENGLWNGYEVKPFTAYEEVELDPGLYVASGYCGADLITDGKNLAWVIDENGILTIKGEGEMANYKNEQIDNIWVTNAPWADYADKITKLVVEEGVLSIGDFAFYGIYGLSGSAIELPEGVTRIGTSAFVNSVSSVTIPESMKYFECDSFCNFEGTIIIYSRPEMIERFTFYNEPVSIYFMNGAPLEIMENAFGYQNRIEATLYYYSGTEDLWEFDKNGLWNGYEVKPFATYEEVELDPSLYIASGYCGTDPLIGGKNLAWGIDENGVLKIFGKGEMADYKYGRLENGQWGVNSPWYQYRNDISDIKMEEGITRISNSAFWGIFDIKDLVIPQSVTSIGSDAFHTAIKGSITIPAAVTEIGSCPFGYCVYLKEINVAKNNPEFASKDGKLYSKDMKTLYAWPNLREEKRAVVPDGVVTIAEGAFNCLAGMDVDIEIILPATVKTIEEDAICSNGKVVIKGQPDLVEDWAFSAWNKKLSIYFFNGAPKNFKTTHEADNNGLIEFYYLSGTEDLWEFDENGLWNGYEVKEYNGYGDINIDFTVDVKDVYLARLVAAKLVVPTETESSFGDVDGDGKITAIDANLIRKFCANIITKFPVGG